MEPHKRGKGIEANAIPNAIPVEIMSRLLPKKKESSLRIPTVQEVHRDPGDQCRKEELVLEGRLLIGGSSIQSAAIIETQSGKRFQNPIALIVVAAKLIRMRVVSYIVASVCRRLRRYAIYADRNEIEKVVEERACLAVATDKPVVVAEGIVDAHEDVNGEEDEAEEEEDEAEEEEDEAEEEEDEAEEEEPNLIDQLVMEFAKVAETKGRYNPNYMKDEIEDDCKDLPVCNNDVQILRILKQISNLSIKKVLMRRMIAELKSQPYVKGHYMMQTDRSWSLLSNPKTGKDVTTIDATIDAFLGLNIMTNYIQTKYEDLKKQVWIASKNEENGKETLWQRESEKKEITDHIQYLNELDRIPEYVKSSLENKLPELDAGISESGCTHKRLLELKESASATLQKEMDDCMSDFENCAVPLSLSVLQEIVDFAMRLYNYNCELFRIPDDFPDDCLRRVLQHVPAPVKLGRCALVCQAWSRIVKKDATVYPKYLREINDTWFTVHNGELLSTKKGVLEKYEKKNDADGTSSYDLTMKYLCDFNVVRAKKEVRFDMSDPSLMGTKLFAWLGGGGTPARKNIFKLCHPSLITIPVGDASFIGISSSTPQFAFDDTTIWLKRGDEMVVADDEDVTVAVALKKRNPWTPGMESPWQLQRIANEDRMNDMRLLQSSQIEETLRRVKWDQKRPAVRQHSVKDVIDVFPASPYGESIEGEGMLKTIIDDMGRRYTLYGSSNRSEQPISELDGATVLGVSSIGAFCHKPGIGFKLWRPRVAGNPGIDVELKEGAAAACQMLSMSRISCAFLVEGRLYSIGLHTVKGERLKNLVHVGVGEDTIDLESLSISRVHTVELPREAGVIRDITCYGNRHPFPIWAPPNGGTCSYGLTIILSESGVGYFLGWHPALGSQVASATLIPLPHMFRCAPAGMSWRGVAVTRRAIILWDDDGILVRYGASFRDDANSTWGYYYNLRDDKGPEQSPFREARPKIDPKSIVQIEGSGVETSGDRWGRTNRILRVTTKTDASVQIWELHMLNRNGEYAAVAGMAPRSDSFGDRLGGGCGTKRATVCIARPIFSTG